MNLFRNFKEYYAVLTAIGWEKSHANLRVPTFIERDIQRKLDVEPDRAHRDEFEYAHRGRCEVANAMYRRSAVYVMSHFSEGKVQLLESVYLDDNPALKGQQGTEDDQYQYQEQTAETDSGSKLWLAKQVSEP